jgi:hypothetical protein
MNRFLFFFNFVFLSICLANAQNVGISDQLFTPQSLLHVYKGSDGDVAQFSLSDAANSGIVFTATGNNWTMRNWQNGELRLQTGNSFMSFFTNAGERMRITAAGNVGIGTDAPNANALLELSSANMGFLAPRVALSAINNFAPLTVHVAGMLVYNTATAGVAPNNVTPGYYYNNGSSWVRFSSSQEAWQISGNAGTNPATNFWGTTDNVDLVVRTNNAERMRIMADGKVGVGTNSPTASYVMTVRASGGVTQAGGIHIPMTASSSSQYGIYISAGNNSARGFLFENTSASNAVLWGTGSVLSDGNIVSGYTAYRTGGVLGSSFGVYGITGTNSVYDGTNPNTWAGFFKGRVVISSEGAPTSPLGVDLEIRNTTTGAAAPATLSLRQTNQLTAINSIMADMNFGDNYTTSPQARIRVVRDAASSNATDLPTAITFWTILDESNVLQERMRVSNRGKLLIGTTTNPAGDHGLVVAGNNEAIILLGTGGAEVGAKINFSRTNLCYIENFLANTLRIHGHNYTNITGTQNSGILGIANANSPFQPQSMLHVYRNANTRFLQLSKSTAENTGLIFSVDGDDWSMWSRDSSSSITIRTVDNFIRFMTGNTAAEVEHMRITDEGNVGIGTTTPQATLDVNGGIRVGDDSTAASAVNVGTIRYRSDANNSWVEMVMQTGAATYSWVIIHTNSW